MWSSNVLLRSSRRGCTMNGAVETYVEWLAGAASTGEIARRLQELLQQLGFDRYSRSEEHTSELQSLMRISYAVLCLKKKKKSTLYIYIINNKLTQRVSKQIK